MEIKIRYKECNLFKEPLCLFTLLPSKKYSRGFLYHFNYDLANCEEVLFIWRPELIHPEMVA